MASDQANPARGVSSMAGNSEEMKRHLDQFRSDFTALRNEIGKVIVGHDEIIDGTLLALIAGGHVLLEGVPGLGKTMLVRTLADALHLKFPRIQFTPDLMPADIIGTNVVLENPEGGRRFEFQPGPIFANLVLADEINRATPKTQSALLEAMQEQSVTVAGKTHNLGRPFFVLATQNPLEMEGTYPLPEAQLDRFFFKLLVKYPSARGDGDDPRPHDRGGRAPAPSRSSTASGSASCRTSPGRSRSPTTSAATASRWSWPRIPTTSWPPRRPGVTSATAQPRGAQAMILAAKIKAILDHRYHVARDDLREVARPGLAAPADPQLRRPGREHPGGRHHRRHPGEGRNASPGRLTRDGLQGIAAKRGRACPLRVRKVLRRRSSIPASSRSWNTSPSSRAGCSAGSSWRSAGRCSSAGAIEFADHREYTPGDDFRYLDWNLFARHDELLLKRFQEEEDLHVYILLDSSRSMAFGTPPKFDYARQVAAALAYIALADLDRVSVIAFAGDILADFPLTRGKARILSLLKFLERLEAQGGGDRPGPRGPELHPSLAAARARGRDQRPVRSRRLRARARPAEASPLRAARHPGA